MTNKVMISFFLFVFSIRPDNGSGNDVSDCSLANEQGLSVLTNYY